MGTLSWHLRGFQAGTATNTETVIPGTKSLWSRHPDVSCYFLSSGPRREEKPSAPCPPLLTHACPHGLSPNSAPRDPTEQGRWELGGLALAGQGAEAKAAMNGTEPLTALSPSKFLSAVAGDPRLTGILPSHHIPHYTEGDTEAKGQWLARGRPGLGGSSSPQGKFPEHKFPATRGPWHQWHHFLESFATPSKGVSAACTNGHSSRVSGWCLVPSSSWAEELGAGRSKPVHSSSEARTNLS